MRCLWLAQQGGSRPGHAPGLVGPPVLGAEPGSGCMFPVWPQLGGRSRGGCPRVRGRICLTSRPGCFGAGTTPSVCLEHGSRGFSRAGASGACAPCLASQRMPPFPPPPPAPPSLPRDKVKQTQTPELCRKCIPASLQGCWLSPCRYMDFCVNPHQLDFENRRSLCIGVWVEDEEKSYEKSDTNPNTGLWKSNSPRCLPAPLKPSGPDACIRHLCPLWPELQDGIA